MFYLYIIQSIKTDEIYIGSTKDLRVRFSDHNKGNTTSTKSARPWKLIYYEAYLTQKLALTREKKLKQYGKSLAMLKKRIGLVD